MGIEPMTVLIVGNKGQLGWALERSAIESGIPTIGVDLPELDLTSQKSVARLIANKDLSTVINAAAYTAVDKAESEVEAAFAVNKDGAAFLADACREKDIPLIHISTDYVFNGNGTTPYKPEDPINPLGVYGKSKAAGENEVRRRLKRHIIIRTSWLYGVHGHNFIKTMLRLAREMTELRVVDDQLGCPTFAGDLADALLNIATQFGSCETMHWGTHHYCNSGVTSWYHLARESIALASRYEKQKVETIIPIPTSDYPTPAPRPHYSALDCSSLISAFGIKPIPWEKSLFRMIATLYGN